MYLYQHSWTFSLICLCERLKINLLVRGENFDNKRCDTSLLHSERANTMFFKQHFHHCVFLKRLYTDMYYEIYLTQRKILKTVWNSLSCITRVQMPCLSQLSMKIFTTMNEERFINWKVRCSMSIRVEVLTPGPPKSVLGFPSSSQLSIWLLGALLETWPVLSHTPCFCVPPTR